MISQTTLNQPALPLLNSSVHALSMSDLNQILRLTILNAKQCTIANHNLHSLYLCETDSKMQRFYHEVADYTHIDGMVLILLGRWLGLPLKRSHRTTYVDWLPVLMSEAAAYQWKVFYLGSKPGIAEEGARRLRAQFPSLKIKTAHGYFDARSHTSENLALIAKINHYQPNILMVGMGMPRQEQWILDHYAQLNVNVILPCGAAIDYFAGAIPTPPRWAGQLGLEWLFRLMADPKRLWQRYLIEPIRLSLLLLVRRFKLS